MKTLALRARVFIHCFLVFGYPGETRALVVHILHPYHPHGGNRKLTPLPPSDVLIHLLLSETIFRSGHYLWGGGLVSGGGGGGGAIKVLPSFPMI